MSTLQSDSYTRQNRRGKTPVSRPRSALNRKLFSVLGLRPPSSERCSGSLQAKPESGCTSILMKFLETLEAKPLSLLLLIVLVLSLGIALHIAGPISIQTHPIEVPGIDIHIGTTSAPAEANQHKHDKHAPARTRPKRSLPRSKVSIGPYF